uniref:Tc1-like transposase DDE domain-containing protein n=1 Tax=Graphocephala atropunctata TaxID=36148 RepID=A0A1B6M0X5_9HEMI
MWFQHDGAPPHFALDVRECLNEEYEDRWIGRGGPVPWPPRSPDLTPIDFYVWGQMKQLVYSTPVIDAMDLVARIVAATAVIQESNDLPATRQSLARRFRLWNQLGGSHFKNLL